MDEREVHARLAGRFGYGWALAETVEERAYKAAHGGRAPASKGTARLRKKRRDAVRRWAESVGYNGTKLVTATRARGNLHLRGGRSVVQRRIRAIRLSQQRVGRGDTVTNTIKVLLTALAGGAGFASICILFTLWRIYIGRKGRPIQYPPYPATGAHPSQTVRITGPRIVSPDGVEYGMHFGPARVEFPEGSGPVTLYGVRGGDTVEHATEAMQRFATGGLTVGTGSTVPPKTRDAMLRSLGKHPLDIGDGETLSDCRSRIVGGA